MVTERCRRAGCDGTIVDGFCDTCGMSAAPAGSGTTSTSGHGASRTSGSSVTSRPSSPISSVTGSFSSRLSRTGSTRTGSSSSRRTGFAGGLVDIPDVPTVDPASLVMTDPDVAEHDRFCASCGEAVGRSKPDRPGRLQGFCSRCRNPYDFSPKLQAGDVVAGQYDVAGCLAHGGLGWIYLARDRNVADRWVVLKGILDSGDETARAAALAERKFLADMEHPAIVKIYNFVAHRGAEYIVMEYVGGKSLKAVLKERRLAAGRPDPLPLDQALAYVIGILPAFEYLHAHAYIYCDFKPDNVIHQGNQLKLIDLGGVRRMGDTTGAVYGTVGFQAPEIAEVGPSVSSDVYTIVRTLAVLSLDFRGYTTDARFGAPDPALHPLLQEFDSLRRIFERGTAVDPDARFGTVGELGDQLEGLLREVQAVRQGLHRPASSPLFTTDPMSMMTRAHVDRVDWHLIPSTLVPVTDPAAGFLNALSALPPPQVGPAIAAAAASGVVRTTEVVLREALATASLGELDRAARLIEEADRLSPGDWRVRWIDGSASLAAGQPDRAAAQFDTVCSWLPGELAPRLALAMALEAGGHHDLAGPIYTRVSMIDPSWVAASFGAARCATARHDRAAAITALARIPTGSALHDEALASKVRVLAGDAPIDTSLDDLLAAEAVITELETTGGRRPDLRLTVLERAFALGRGSAATAPGPAAPPPRLLGRPVTDRGLRSSIEAALRELARQTDDRAERIRLVDSANRIRPRTVL